MACEGRGGSDDRCDVRMGCRKRLEDDVRGRSLCRNNPDGDHDGTAPESNLEPRCLRKRRRGRRCGIAEGPQRVKLDRTMSLFCLLDSNVMQVDGKK